MDQALKQDVGHVPFVEASSYPVRDGNFVRPLVDGDPAYRRICEAVESAQSSVWVTVAFITEDFKILDYWSFIEYLQLFSMIKKYHFGLGSWGRVHHRCNRHRCACLLYLQHSRQGSELCAG